MKRTKFKKINTIIYKCIYCDLEKKVTPASYLAHLDMEHQELNEDDKNELVKDIENKIYRYNKEEKRRLEEKDNKKSTRLDLADYKDKVLDILKPLGLEETNKELIQSSKKIAELKQIINSKLTLEFKRKLDEAGIDYYIHVPRKETGIHKNKKCEYFDESINSVKLLYTPMGNKK